MWSFDLKAVFFFSPIGDGELLDKVRQDPKHPPPSIMIHLFAYTDRRIECFIISNVDQTINGLGPSVQRFWLVWISSSRSRLYFLWSDMGRKPIGDLLVQHSLIQTIFFA